MISRLIQRLPARFRWTIHNIVAHPVSEVLEQLGCRELAQIVHDATLPPREGS